jgi:hypothetical protein
MDDLKWPSPRMDFPYDSDPVVAYARRSHNVRFAISLQMRIENEITALLASNPPSRPLPQFPPPPVGHLPRPEKDLSAFREEVRENVLEAIKPGFGDEDRDEAQMERLRNELHEKLAEGQRFDAYLSLSLSGAVMAICKDLGVIPLVGRWTGEG